MIFKGLSTEAKYGLARARQFLPSGTIDSAGPGR
jgi:hypothetical protein